MVISWLMSPTASYECILSIKICLSVFEMKYQKLGYLSVHMYVESGTKRKVIRFPLIFILCMCMCWHLKPRVPYMHFLKCKSIPEMFTLCGVCVNITENISVWCIQCSQSVLLKKKKNLHLLHSYGLDQLIWL